MIGICASKRPHKNQFSFLRTASFGADIVSHIDNTGNISDENGDSVSHDVQIENGETINFYCYKGFVVCSRNEKVEFCFPLAMIRKYPFQIAAYGFTTNDSFELNPLFLTKVEIEDFLVKNLEKWTTNPKKERRKFFIDLMETLIPEVSATQRDSLRFCSQFLGQFSVKTLPSKIETRDNNEKIENNSEYDDDSSENDEDNEDEMEMLK